MGVGHTDWGKLKSIVGGFFSRRESNGDGRRFFGPCVVTRFGDDQILFDRRPPKFCFKIDVTRFGDDKILFGRRPQNSVLK